MLVATVYLSCGCGYGQFQTARTTPKGKARVMMAQGVQFNENTKEQTYRGFSVFNLPPQMDLRVGVSDRVDVGAKLLMISGLLLDTKVNLMPPSHNFALALTGGVGVAIDTGSIGDGYDGTAWLLNLPIGLIASYRIGGWFSPYFGATYGFYWIFGRSLSYELYNSDSDYAAREGYGDGLLRLTAGAELATRKHVAFLVEYSFFWALVDDPGDNFAFVNNHLFGIGIAF